MPRRDTPKPHCGGRWTKARFKSFVTSALRRASGRWQPKHEARKRARIGRNQYVCAACAKTVGNKFTHIDHIEPVVDTVRGFVSWDEFIRRLFVEVDGFRLLCTSCHKEVTQKQREQRKLRK